MFLMQISLWKLISVWWRDRIVYSWNWKQICRKMFLPDRCAQSKPVKPNQEHNGIADVNPVINIWFPRWLSLETYGNVGRGLSLSLWGTFEFQGNEGPLLIKYIWLFPAFPHSSAWQCMCGGNEWINRENTFRLQIIPGAWRQLWRQGEGTCSADCL